jgi:hypothetical protein
VFKPAPAKAGGNTADPMTLAAQIDKLKQRFKLQRVVMVGDRGLLTSARIEQTLRPAGLDWITALRAPAIKQLAAEGVRAGKSGHLECRPGCQGHGRDCGPRQIIGPGSSLVTFNAHRVKCGDKDYGA